MRPARVLDRAASAARSSATRRARVRRAAAFVAILALACRGDSATDPLTSGRLAPSEPLLELTGGVGTQIFPTVAPGDRQPRGDARGLNASGQVTGGAFGLPGDQNGSSEPYRWTPGGSAVRITGCCDSKVGNDINDAGTVVGNAQKDQISGARAFVATGTTIVHLPLLPGGDPGGSSWAVAINNAGQIAGMSVGPGFAEHAVLWSSSLVPQDLGTLGGTNSYSIDLNASGQVIGWSQLAGDATSTFFLWSPGAGMVDLSTINPAITDVVEIHDYGQITGPFTTAGGQSHAFLHTPGSGLLDLGTLGGTSSAPTGLNNRGDVVGTSTLPDGTPHAFLWTATDGMEDITALTGATNLRRLNDSYQTLAGATSRPARGFSVPFNGRPTLLQLQVTQNNAPPTAVFTVECNGLTCVLDASGSFDDKPGLTFDWDVNKYPGPYASGEKVTITYPHASQRTITLTVTDANGVTSSASKTITISDFPIAAFTYTCTGLTCSFDSSGSTNGGNPITYWIWDFGDDVRNSSNLLAAPSHTYAQPGTYTVKLEVWGSSSSERGIVSQQITVSAAPEQNQPPVASFTVSCTSFVCSFDATGSTDDKAVVSYSWALGKAPDGTASGPTVTTDYWHESTRTVTLTVTDAEGLSNSVTRTFQVGATEEEPTDAPPVARFTSSCSGTVCTLDASTSSDDVGITSYAWSLGKSPEGSATGVTVTTDYWHTSTRTVTLTVTDTKGQTNSVTKTVVVP